MFGLKSNTVTKKPLYILLHKHFGGFFFFFFFPHPIDFDLLQFSRSCAVNPGPRSHAPLFNMQPSSHIGNVQPADAQ